MSKISIKKKKVAGVEALRIGNQLFYYVVVLEHHKDNIKVCLKALINNIQEVSEVVDKNIPVCLIINMKGVIHKKINKQAESRILSQEVFPHIKASEFYWQKIAIKDNVVVSIVRRDVVDEVLMDFSNHGLWVTGLVLGSFHIQDIIPFLTEIDRLSISGYDFHFSKDKILEHFEKRPSAETFDSSTVNIGGDNLDTQMLPAYAAALTSLTNGIGHLDIEIVQSNVQEFFHKQLFNRTLPLMLYMLFGILLANTFFYYHFKSKNETYRSLLSQKKHELTSLDSLKNHVKQQQEFFHQTNINQSMQASFYADRIGASIPKGIQLIELNLFPLRGKVMDYAKEELIQYQVGKIVLTGRCESSLIYNSWLRSLQEFSWVNKIEHLTYTEMSSTEKEFEMQLFTTQFYE